MPEHATSELADVLEPYPWDYLLGSVHWIDGLAVDQRRALGRGTRSRRSGRSTREELEAAARSGQFDVLAHPDLVKIFGDRVEWNWPPVIDALARRRARGLDRGASQAGRRALSGRGAARRARAERDHARLGRARADARRPRLRPGARARPRRPGSRPSPSSTGASRARSRSDERLRVGIGVDAHALRGGRAARRSAASRFPSPRGLAGHSDGDVLTHALIDAILGAAGLADIGAMFPAGDASGRAHPRSTCSRARTRRCGELGFELVNADCILIGEEPRLAPYRREMALPSRRRARSRRAARRRPRDDHGRPRLHGARRGPRGAVRRSARARMNVVRYADRPDLLEIRFETLTRPTFPEYMNNNVPGNLYWGRLYEDFPDFQLALLDGDDLVAELHSVPTAWDGSDDDLRAGGTRRSCARSRAGARRTCSVRSRSRSGPIGRASGSRAACSTRCAAPAGRTGSRLIAPVRPTRK